MQNEKETISVNKIDQSEFVDKMADILRKGLKQKFKEEDVNIKVTNDDCGFKYITIDILKKNFFSTKKVCFTMAIPQIEQIGMKKFYTVNTNMYNIGSIINKEEDICFLPQYVKIAYDFQIDPKNELYRDLYKIQQNAFTSEENKTMRKKRQLLEQSKEQKQEEQKQNNTDIQNQDEDVENLNLLAGKKKYEDLENLNLLAGKQKYL